MTGRVFQSLVTFSLCFLGTLVSTQICYDNQWFIFRSVATGLAVDARDPTAVTLKGFDGSDYQQWKFQSSWPAGAYFIINKASGNVLEIDADKYVTTVPQDCLGAQQQTWFVYGDGRVGAWQGGDLESENDYLVDGARLRISDQMNATVVQFFVEEYVGV
ncbi:hypothetical protein Zmor_001573 [Zophobas morio]|uniref:Ricin B lectin domain-containing protein n=1 Tax=Zophobas morio TaxID=2755281 RepID=A0AA38IZD3_9CUCU|nr:hypothetical protein Zmor_001573 [Zophobas morio]